MRKFAALFLLSALLSTSATAQDSLPDIAPGNAGTGAVVFKTRCAMCHSLVQNKAGPRLSGVVGRKAGVLADYNYSLALKKSGLIWNEATLTKWLVDPTELVSGTKMLLSLRNPQDRADVIAYLKTVPVPPQ